MAEKDRICPSCGGATHSTTCDICGRRTSMNKKNYANKTGSNDHPYIENEHPVYDDTDKRNHGHIQEMLKQGKSYRKETVVKSYNFANLSKGISIIIVIVVAVFLLGTILYKDEYEAYQMDEQYDNYYEQSDYYSQFLSVVEDDVEITCSIDEDNSQRVNITNPSPYIYDADLKDDYFFDTIWSGKPYSSDSLYYDEPINTCELENIILYEMNFGATDIPYELKETDYNVLQIHVEEVLTKDDINGLMEHIYAMQFFTFSDFGYDLELYLDEELAYLIYFDYDNRNITFEAQNGFVHIENLDMYWK